MYPVSNAYKTKISQSNINDEITGTIILTDNTIINFTDEDIKENSFYFKESCVAGQTLEYGNVNSSLLVLTLFTYLENIYSLDGAMIKPVYRLELDSGSFEEVPLGTFFVTKIERQDDAVKLEAMDGMVLLGKSVLGVSTTGKARDIILSICAKCGVELITNGTTFSTFPNYSVDLTLPAESKVETCLDLLMWVCSSVGCSARFDRTGKLEIRLVTGGTASKIVSGYEQMLTKLSDFSSKISGISYDKTIIGNESGIVLKQDTNPLWSDKKESQTASFLTNILNRITLAEYIAGNTEIWGDPAIQAGDYITLEETSKGDVKILVTSHSWHYRGKHSITSAGTSNKVAGIYSQGEKRILSATKKAEKAEKTATLAEEKAAELEELVETTRADFNSAIEVLDGEMGSVTAQIGELETDINGIQAEYSTLYAEIYDTEQGLIGRMTSAETQISIVAGEISSKVSQADYDEYISITGDTITQIESDLSLVEQTASSISATVAGQSVLIDGLQTSYADQQAQINIQADQISQTVTQTEFNNLQIGGRNVLYNSDFKKPLISTQYRTNGVGYDVSIDDDGYNDGKALKVTVTSGANSPFTHRVVMGATITPEYGAKYTFSGWIKGSVACDLIARWGESDVSATHAVTTDWTYFSLVIETAFTSSTNFFNTIIPYFSKVGTFYFSQIKLEKGNKATDWSPAPEDVDSAIITVDSRVTQTVDDYTVAFKTIGVGGYTRTGKTEITIDGLTVYNGAIKIKNNVGTDVLKTDTNGNLDVTGKITATSGKVGGWVLADNILKSGSGNNGVVLKSSGTVRIAAGLARSMIDAGSSAIDNSTGSITTYLTNSGYFKCADADITGKITATSGKIANFNIQGNVQHATSSGYRTVLKSDGQVAFATGVPTTNDYNVTTGANLQIYHNGNIISSGSTVSTHISGGSLEFRYSSTVAGGISARNISGVGVSLDLECSMLSMNGLRTYTQTIPVVTPTGAKNLYFSNGIFIGIVEEV